jgi:predicted lipid carrier protein YhbT
MKTRLDLDGISNRRAFAVAAVALCLTLAGCGSEPNPAPVDDPPAVETGSLIVRGAAEVRYEVFDASGHSVAKTYTGKATELPTGEYRIGVHGVAMDARVGPGSETVAAETGTLIVRGKGEVRYAVLDPNLRKLDEKWTNTRVELLPGDYIVELRGTRLDVTVDAGEETVAAETGSLIVRGTGQVRYAVLDGNLHKLDEKWTNTRVELLPGDYIVELRGTRLAVQVESGREAVAAETGSLIVRGAGRVRYAVLDTERRKLDEKWTNTSVELLPGDYVVELRGTQLDARVESGREAVAAETGGLIVRGGGHVRYRVLDENLRKLEEQWTNTSVELLPGDYTVEVHGARLDARVESGRETLAAETGDLIVSGDGQVRYAVYDEAQHKLGESWTNAGVELLPGSYLVRLDDRDMQAVIEAGRQTRVGP